MELTVREDYNKIFDSDNPKWDSNPQANLLFLTMVQNHANDMFQSRGYILLNDVNDLLGFERTFEGSVVGWHCDSDGDGYVGFGDFDNDGHKQIFLHFNVDGIIIDKLPRE